MQYDSTTAMVTGASSGLGVEFAKAWARRGADLVLVARREEALERIAAEIRAETGRQVHVIAADLSAEGSGERLAAAVDERGLRVDTVINNAGAGLTRDFAASSQEEVARQVRLNVDAVVGISHAFLPQLQRSGRGALVNVASLTAYAPTPGMAVYAASKAFVLRFTEALAYEQRGSGPIVLAVSPGPTRTGFYRASDSSEAGVRFETPEQVVAAAMTALDRGAVPPSVVSGRRNRWTSRVLSVLPVRTVLRLANASPA